MEISLRDAITVVHGMFFGTVLLLAFTGAAVGLFVTSAHRNPWTAAPGQRHALTRRDGGAVGAYGVYPWYRATPLAGIVDLSGFPQRLLLSNPHTADWHEIGMEWKEHIAWFAPIALAAVAFIHARYGFCLHAMKALRSALFGLVALAFVSTSVAGFFGAMLNKHAPVRGGPTLVLIHGRSHG